MTESRTTWTLLRRKPYYSRVGEGKVIKVDTDRDDLARQARLLNRTQRNTRFFKQHGYQNFKYTVVAVKLS